MTLDDAPVTRTCSLCRDSTNLPYGEAENDGWLAAPYGDLCPECADDLMIFEDPDFPHGWNWVPGGKRWFWRRWDGATVRMAKMEREHMPAENVKENP